MRKLIILSVCLAGSFLATSTVVDTQGRGGQQARFSAIVVYNSNVSFENQRGNYRADDRDAADPDAWGYLDRGVHGKTQALERQHGFRADKIFSSAVRGFSADLTAAQIVTLENDPTVDFVEADGPASIVAQTVPWGIARVGANTSSIDATGVNVYVIDTGIDSKHKDLNTVRSVNFAGGQNADCNGHGTHVAGTIAARNNSMDVVGVAPGAPLTAVKVLGCSGSGTMSGVIKGVDWVTANRVLPAVANMSLGGGVSVALDNAVKASAAAGVVYAIAAGNSGANACNSSPASAGLGDNGIITTAATDSTDKEASWSNFGTCVDIWAPGVNILSTRKGGGTTTMSGTSMASPHVAGAVALYLAKNGITGPTQVEAALESAAPATGTTSKSGAAIHIVNVSSF